MQSKSSSDAARALRGFISPKNRFEYGKNILKEIERTIQSITSYLHAVDFEVWNVPCYETASWIPYVPDPPNNFS